VVAKQRMRLLVCKRTTKPLEMQRFDLRKLNYAAVKEKY
jgi:hypothetical protein